LPPPPPPPPAPDACAKGNHSGHAVASSGNATGHRCAGGERHARGHKHGHRHHNHRAKAAALMKKLARFCGAFFGGRH
jgi:hypothetical protein